MSLHGTSPLRRLVIGVGMLIVALALSTVVVWSVQTRALAEALVGDALMTAGRTVKRDPVPTAPAHANGFACLASLEAGAPSDLAPFELEDRETLSGLLDAGVLPEPWLTKVQGLQPWAGAVRSCGNSAGLKFIDGVITPFRPFEKPTHTLALAHMTQLQVRLLGVEARWEAAAELCAETIAVTLDRSHVSLYEAWLAGVALEYLVPGCGEALLRLPVDARADAIARFSALPGRLVSNRELIETDRQLVALHSFGWLLTNEQLSRLPARAEPVLRPETLDQFALALTWSRYDRAVRRLVEVADGQAPLTLRAARGVESARDVWWLPGSPSNAPSQYLGRLHRNDTTAALLRLLVVLAEGGRGPFPPQVRRTSAGIEFSDDGRSVEPGWSSLPVTVVIPTP